MSSSVSLEFEVQESRHNFRDVIPYYTEPLILAASRNFVPLREQIGMQVELHAHPGMTAQIMEMERVLRLLPSCVTGDSGDVRIPDAQQNDGAVIENALRRVRIAAQFVLCWTILFAFVLLLALKSFWCSIDDPPSEYCRTSNASCLWTTPATATCLHGCWTCLRSHRPGLEGVVCPEV